MLNADIQNCYKIEMRTKLWQQEYIKAMKKEQEKQIQLQQQKELELKKKKLKRYVR